MLTLRRCREILGPACSLADSKLELLRDDLTALADIALEVGREKFRQAASNTFEEALRLVPDELREETIERAAIVEFDGNFEQSRAEEVALKACVTAQRRRKNDASISRAKTPEDRKARRSIGLKERASRRGPSQ